jgi:hypothetical protein
MINRGKSAGQQCTNGGHHNGYCWKHKKAVVPKDVAEAVTGGAHQEKRPKYKFSAFRFTVNSNTSATKMTPAQVGEFKRLIGFVFDKDKVVDYLKDQNAPDPKTNISEVDSMFHFEIAPGNKTVHVHGVVKLKHTGHYSMVVERIRGVISGVLGKKVHVNIQASGDADRAWEQYMEKSQSADKLE